jgi:tetratricopeptide (TPR) repeat protein
MNSTRIVTGLCACLLSPVPAIGAPAAPPTAASVAELTDIREIGALDQKTLDEAEATFFDGLGHYRAGRFEAAAQAFQKAHALTRHRDMLFNVARSRERMGDVPGAVEWYRAYLATQPADETAVIHKVRQLGAEPVVQAPRRTRRRGPRRGRDNRTRAGPVALDCGRGGGRRPGRRNAHGFPGAR